jgi:hypothetical protein
VELVKQDVENLGFKDDVVTERFIVEIFLIPLKTNRFSNNFCKESFSKNLKLLKKRK